MNSLWQDLRYGARSLAKKPAFTFVAVATLALGIGANAAIFDLMDAVMLRSLPVRSPEQLVLVATRTAEGGLHQDMSYPLYAALRDGNDVFSGMLAATDASFGVSAGSQTERISGEYVSANYFDLLGIRPVLGSAFAAGDERPGAQPAAVISDDLWNRFFARDPAATRSSISINGRPFYVVGVAPHGFVGLARGMKSDVWITLPHYAEFAGRPNLLSARTTSWLTLMARLKPGLSLQQAQSRLTAELPGGFEAARGAGNWEAALTPAAAGVTFYVNELTEPLRLLLLVVIMILAIACANVANLLLSRAQARRREIGVRLALGATRARIIRQLMTENMVLALAGGGAGLLIAFYASDFASSLRTPFGGALKLDASISGRVLAFTLVVSTLTALVFGLAPAFRASRLDVASVLKEGGAGGSVGNRVFSLRSALVVGQIALSLILLAGAGLFLHSLLKVQRVDTGLSSDKVLAVSMDVGLQGYNQARGQAFYSSALERVGAIPGVSATSLASVLPVTAGGRRLQRPANQTLPAVDEEISIDIIAVSPGFFHTIGLDLVSGRDFRALDTANSGKVIIINQTMANEFWPNQDPVGQSFFDGNGSFEVVGVAHNTKYRSLREEPRMTMYQPVAQDYRGAMNLLVGSSIDPQKLLPALREQLRAIDSSLPVFNIRTLSEHIGRSLYVERLQTALSAGFGLLALVLTAIGIYGVMSFNVAQRTREMGIRVALGAERKDLYKLVLGLGLILTACGIAAGLIGALALTKTIESLLFGVNATDPLTFSSVSLLLAGISLVACYIPARRAAKVDPMAALRHE